MQKIPSVFKRNYDGDRLCFDEVVEGCEWVLEGEGVATEKFDGTPCLLRDGKLFKRYDRKPTKKAKKQHENGTPWKEEDLKSAPAGWEPCEPAANLHTGHWPGWLPINGDDPADKYHVEAFAWFLEVIQSDAKEHMGYSLKDGTLELIGPKVQGNLYGLDRCQLWRHGSVTLTEYIPPGTPRTYESIRQILKGYMIEGVVFHLHDEDGKVVKMAKLKRKDVGLAWPIPQAAPETPTLPKEGGSLNKLEEQLAKVNA